MPKKVKSIGEAVHVTGYIRDFLGRPMPNQRVTISLPVACLWAGNIILKRQQCDTDPTGKFEFWLPPTSELEPTKPGRGNLEYTINCEGIGSWKFKVPDGIEEMRIGEEKEGGKRLV